MHVEFDRKRIEEAADRYPDIATNIHAMTSQHTEILGQFMDHTALSPNELIKFLLFGVEKFNERLGL